MFNIVIFLTGLSGVGKTTIGKRLATILRELYQFRVAILDNDHFRKTHTKNLTHAREDRIKNDRVVMHYTKISIEKGNITIVCGIFHNLHERRQFRQMFGCDFLEVFLATSPEFCMKNRPWLYNSSEIKCIVGVDLPYEYGSADLVLNTELHSESECAQKIIKTLRDRNLLREL